MARPDPMLERIEAFNRGRGGGVVVRRAANGRGVVFACSGAHRDLHRTDVRLPARRAPEPCAASELSGNGRAVFASRLRRARASHDGRACASSAHEGAEVGGGVDEHHALARQQLQQVFQ